MATAWAGTGGVGNTSARGEGGGGGGAVRATPVGVIEVSTQQTRFIANILGQASVKAIYGEPIAAHGKTASGKATGLGS